MKFTDDTSSRLYYQLSKRQRKIFNRLSLKGLSQEVADALRRVCDLPFDQVPLKLNKADELAKIPPHLSKRGLEDLCKKVLLIRLELGS